MKEQAIEVATHLKEPQQARNQLREYLQHRILYHLFLSKALVQWVFHGGTALRILHNLPRFSEDLDFHLGKDQTSSSFEEILKKIQRSLESEGYEIEQKSRMQTNVQSSFIQFPGLLYECGLSSLRKQKLAIKIELDTQPPSGWQTEASFVSTYANYSVRHHDKSSFIAGKLHAIFQRSYTKGRDYFDLMFYLSRWKTTAPNFEYLNQCLKQSGFRGEEMGSHNWLEYLQKKVEQMDWEEVLKDVSPFIQEPAEFEAFEKEILLSMILNFQS